MTLLLSNGVVYRGELDVEHCPHGEGCVLDAEGQVIQKGTFDHGRLHGFDCTHESRDHRYEGDMRHGLRSGVGKETHKLSGKVTAGEWVNDQLHGFVVMMDCNGVRTFCGRTQDDGALVECPVPLSRMPKSLFGEERGQSHAPPS